MKSLAKVLIVLILMSVTYSCKKKDDDGGDEAVTCDEWFEGDPCEAMVAKFIGDYVGGAGFCGTDYEYEVTMTPNVPNGISIGQANPGSDPYYLVHAILTSSTEFNIPEQEVEFYGEIFTLMGYGNGDGNSLFYHVESPSISYDCDHEATKV